MRKLRWQQVMVMGIVSFALSSAQNVNSASLTPELQQIVEGAKKEGQLRLVWGGGSLGGTAGVEMFEAAMNRMFGTKIDIKYSPGPSMPSMGSQIAAEYAAGQSSVTDVYIAAASYAAPLVQRQIFHTVNWPQLLPGRITDEMTEGNNSALRILSGLPGVPYNTRRVPKSGMPDTMDGFLKPEWKGKIASTPYAAGFDSLADKSMWGPEKTIEYVGKLSKQIAGLIRCNEIERVASGEFIALVLDCNGASTAEAKLKGAPVDLMIPTDAAQIRYFYLAVPKNAENPNAAKLFTTFVMTKEGQEIVWKTTHVDLHFFPEARTRPTVEQMKQKGVRFFEPTIQWSLDNPEIDKLRGKIAKMLRSPK